jgi:SAM-dependent methyltransferase
LSADKIFPSKFWETAKRLIGYFQMYWLKPFDAVNDTANAMALLNYDWSHGPILEIGGGDGVFSFIMHGGKYAFADDRYDQTDVDKPGDIYDTYSDEKSLNIKKAARIQYDAGVDLKLSHVSKALETGLYKNNRLLSSVPEQLPLEDNSFATVFLYTFHGLTDYRKTLLEVHRILMGNGTLLLLGFNQPVKDNFICYRCYKYFEKRGFDRLANYFKNLDGGRYDEIGGLFARDYKKWQRLFEETGFYIENVQTQVSSRLWRIYDTQTRPLLKKLIKLNHFLKKLGIKPLIKLLWIILWLPVLLISYFIMARPRKVNPGLPRGIFLAFNLRKI